MEDNITHEAGLPFKGAIGFLEGFRTVTNPRPEADSKDDPSLLSGRRPPVRKAAIIGCL